MSFLEEFDQRAEAAKNQTPPPPPLGDLAEDDKALLDFADLMRARLEQPVSIKDEAERAKLLRRIQSNQEIFDEKAKPADRGMMSKRQRIWYWSITAAAALFMFSFLLKELAEFVGRQTVNPIVVNPTNLGTRTTVAASDVKDDFANTEFPKPILTALEKQTSVERPATGDTLRVTRVHGLAMVQSAGEKHWRVLARGSEIRPGDTLRTSERLDSAVRLLCRNGSAITLGPGSNLVSNNPTMFTLNQGEAEFDLASNDTAQQLAVSIPMGYITTADARFTLHALPPDANNPAKNTALVRVARGTVALASFRGAESKTVAAGGAAAWDARGISVLQKSIAAAGHSAWVRALELEASADHGIGQLVAKTEKANEHLPLEIVSHAVTVTCVDQVARTFVDETFFNNTDRRLEGTFYYPLPDDAAIGEFAMYVDGKRIAGEVLEQGKARQVFEYIVRQQKDPALLEWAGGNLFKMRVFPIEPHSSKRVQLGYTQILPLRDGVVSYTYPLFSEMLLKNPLQKLSIEFRVLSNYGLAGLQSPTHECAVALDPDGRRGTLAFSAKKYSPTCDFNATYHVSTNPECVALGNMLPDDPDGYFMLQLAPKAALAAPKVPERLLVIVDGSAAGGAQGYAVASEFAAVCADLSSNWELAVLRGGQNPEVLDLARTRTVISKKLGLTVIDSDSALVARNTLAGKPPLGATDLLATFELAAQLAQDGQGLQILYVGTGIDTVSELSSSALVEKIAALFGDKNVRLSTVAVGSTYERAVLQNLAGALGGSFFRVEGAADVATAAGKVFEDFYRPRFWNARVKISGVDTADVYSEELGTLAAGDSALVLGRIKNPGQSATANIFFTADSTAGKVDRSYTAVFNLEKERNQFLPRLWARAHNEALTARMGLADSSADAKLRTEISETSIKYQIMSPFTSFLVLESDEDYAKYGIQRTMKRTAWMSGEPRAASNGIPKAHFANRLNEWGFNPAGQTESLSFLSSINGDLGGGTTFGRGVDIFSLRNSVWGEGRSAGESEFSGLDPGVLLGDFGDLSNANQFYFGSNRGGVSRSIQGELDFKEVEELSASGESEFGVDGELAADFDGSMMLATDEFSSLGKSKAFFKSGRLSAHYQGQNNFGFMGGLGYYSGARYSQSSIFPNDAAVRLGAPVEKNPALNFKIDQPLQPLALYRKMALRDAENASARLHWVLALQAESDLKSALKELQPLLEKFPAAADLRLLEGELLLHSEQPDAGATALAKALQTVETQGVSKENRDAFAEKIAALYSNIGQYLRAAEGYAALARAAAKPEVSARLAAAAAYAWQNAKKIELGTALWDEMLKRWLESADVKAGAGRWLISNSKKNDKTSAVDDAVQMRGLKLLRAALAADPKLGLDFVSALIEAGRVDEDRVEAAKLFETADDPEEVYRLLGALNQPRQQYAIDECKRLLRGKLSSTQYAGVVRYWTNYSVKGDKEFTGLIVAGLKNESLSLAARAGAAENLLRYNVKGVTAEELVGLYKKAAVALKTIQEFTDANYAATWLLQQKKYQELIEFSQALRANGAIKDDARAAYIAFEFQAFDGLKRSEEFKALHFNDYFGPNAKASEADTRALTVALLQSLIQNGDALGAAELAQLFEKRYLNSELVPRFHAAALSALAQIKEPKERDEKLARLTNLHPEQLLYAEFAARSLAQKRKFKEASDALHAALKNAAPRADKSRAIQLLARVSAQDAGLREAFLKEAAENEKTQNHSLREWTEAGLTCAHEAGDMDKYLGALVVYLVSEPADPEWGQQLAAGLMESGKTKEGREAFEALSNAQPSDANLAFVCQRICLEQKDEAGAQKFLDRAFEALAANSVKLSQFAANMQSQNPTLALRAYELLIKNPKYAHDANTLLSAANLARDSQQLPRAVELYFAVLLDKNDYYISGAANELAKLAQQEYLNTTISLRASAELLKAPGAVQSSALHLLQYKLKKLKQDNAGAKAEMDAALAVELPENTVNYLGSELLETLAQSGEYARLEQFAMSGGGALSNSDRRQLLHGALNQLGSDAQRAAAIRILRKLLEDQDSNANEDRRQLAERLLEGGELDAALAEIRKFDESANAWNTWHCWERLIDAFNSKGSDERAVDAALEMWGHLQDDENYSWQVLRKLSSTIMTAAKDNKLNAAVRAQAEQEMRAELNAWFSGERVARNQYEYSIIETLKALKLQSEADALALAAEASGSFERVLASAEYASGKMEYERAARLYKAALILQPGNQAALDRLLDIEMNHTHDWAGALKTLDALKGLQSERSNLANRVLCLGQLGKLDEACAVCRTLMTPAYFKSMSLYEYRDLAQTCGKNKDYTLTVEVWEVALKSLARSNGGRIQPNVAAEFYAACGRAYKSAGQESKALDCFLRGMSAIPREDSNYKQVLDAALENVLRGKSLDQAVATHENNVATEGGDKPHLRLAFAEGYKRQDKTHEMLAQLRAAADLLPKDMRLRHETIDGYKKIGDSQKALESYQAWAKLDPQNIELYKGWGDLYDSLGRREEALQAWASMAQVRPREAEGYRACAQKLEALKLHEKAAAALRQAVKYRPTEFEISKELADVYGKILSAAEAAEKIKALWSSGEAACRKAMVDLPDDPAPWLNLGRFLEAQARVKEARELYEKIAVRTWPRFQNETVAEARKRLMELILMTVRR